MRVVVADDNEIDAQLLADLLQELGHQVVGIAKDGEDAIRRTQELRPDVVFLDIVMPRMSGITAAVEISRAQLAPIIMLTAYTDQELVTQAAEAGALAYLVKPPEPETIQRTLAMVTARFQELQTARQEAALMRLTGLLLHGAMLHTTRDMARIREDYTRIREAFARHELEARQLEELRARATIAEVAMRIAQERDLASTVAAVLTLSRETLRVDAVAVWLADEERRELDLLAERGLPPDFVGLIEHVPYDSPFLVGRVARSRRVEYIGDLATAPQEEATLRGLGERYGLRCAVVAPMRARGRFIGVMAYITRESRRYRQDELDTIQTIADIFGVGIDNARLYDQINQERQRLATLVETLPVGVVLAEPDGRIAVVNHAAEFLVGRPKGEFVLLPPPEFGFLRSTGEPCPSEEFPLARALLRGEASQCVPLIIRRPDGSAAHLLVNGAPVVDPDGRTIGAVTTFMDITPLRELERQREEFISMVVHDLRLPVTVIMGFAGWLARLAPREHGTDMEQKAVENIRSSARRLASMLSDLLDVSRIEARRLTLVKERTDIVALLRGVMERMTQMLEGRSLRLQVKATPPQLQVDPSRIEQVLSNLLSNAVKYSYPNTEILIEVEPLPPEHPQEVMISVTNQGRGIPPEELTRIFTPFYRTRLAVQERKPGLGLGLYISKGIVEAHGGRLWAESVVGRYATFRFTLPIQA